MTAVWAQKVFSIRPIRVSLEPLQHIYNIKTACNSYQGSLTEQFCKSNHLK